MRYWISTDIRNEPENLYRVYKTDEGHMTTDVWYQGAWQEGGPTETEMYGLGGSADYRLIRREDEERLIPMFKESLSYDDS